MSGKASQLTINKKGFDNMVAYLMKQNGMTYRDTVRGIAAATLTKTAQRTGMSSQKKIKESIAKIFRKPYTTSTGAKVGLTKAGLLWYSGADWSRDNWVLVSSSGKIMNSKGTTRRTWQGESYGKEIQLSPRLKSEINTAMREAREFRAAHTKYLISQIGAGRATWLEIMLQLQLQPTNLNKLEKAAAVRLPSAHRAALQGKQIGTGNKYTIQVISRSQSALNPRAGGISAFSRSLNGQIKAFETAAKTDAVTYANKFAATHGFKVSA